MKNAIIKLLEYLTNIFTAAKLHHTFNGKVRGIAHCIEHYRLSMFGH